jgi:hypothetical protein
MLEASAMREILFSSSLPDGREVCVSPISKDTFEANRADTVGDDSGYFIYEFDNAKPSSGIEVLAKAVSLNAALRLVDIFLLASRKAPKPA